MIEPKTLKGFRDSLPNTELIKEQLIAKITDVFRNFAYVPIDTPALEYSEILLGKGGGETEKQIFRFTDNGNRDVALRFDLTVPLARFVAANSEQLTFPFKRYHIAKVWRGEKPQKGRYREFLQCDFDIVGADNALSDFETLSVICACLDNISVPDYKIHISHRALTSSLLASLNIAEKNEEVLRIIDKLPKIGLEEVKTQLKQLNLTDEQLDKISQFITLPADNYDNTLNLLIKMFGTENFAIKRLIEIKNLASSCNLIDRFLLDTSIARGLDYYTGLVWETFLQDLPQIGSVCSGGRYDNLASLYTSRTYSCVGSCIGLDRLLAALNELNSPIIQGSKASDILVLTLDNPQWSELTASKLREHSIKTDCYLGKKNKGAQFAYAQAKNIPYVLCSEDENGYTVKDLSNGQLIENLSFENLLKIVNDRS